VVYLDNWKIEEKGKVILQENHYYPYGKEISSLGRKGTPNHEFTYNGKELSEEFNWNTYDYGARGLDADFPVWKQVDPLAEKMRRWSPYAYAFSNPVRFIDPDGMMPTPIQDKVPPKIIKRQEWGARKPIIEEGRDYEKISGNVKDYYKTIVIHHSGNDSSYPSMNDIQDEHMDGAAKKADIGYHFGIDKNGKIYEGRDINIKGAHVDKANTGKLGIVLLGDMDTQDKGLSFFENAFEFSDDELTTEMRNSLENLVEYLSSEYSIEFLGGHNDVNCERHCPGDMVESILPDIRKKFDLKLPFAETGN
jgi:RHS repeat-associated protein